MVKLLRVIKDWREFNSAIESNVLSLLAPNGDVIDLRKIRQRLSETVIATNAFGRRIADKKLIYTKEEAHAEIVRLRTAYMQLEGQGQQAIGKLIRGFEIVFFYPSWIKKL